MNSTKTYTVGYIRSLPCWACNKPSETNRHLELYDRDGKPVVCNEPIVICITCWLCHLDK